MEDYELFKSDSQVLLDNADMLKNVGFSDCPIGWSQLVRQLFEDIRETCKKNNSPVPKVLQVKSKFGGLCFYLDHDPIFEASATGIEIDRLVIEAEKKSLTICEITGHEGTLHLKNHWYATLSEAKANELGYIKCKNDNDRA
jgi:hypothetical protein